MLKYKKIKAYIINIYKINIIIRNKKNKKMFLNKEKKKLKHKA